MTYTKYTIPMLEWSPTDEGFRIWGKSWTDMLDYMGFTQVYSNIDWASATMPTVANTYVGKRVYKFEDTLSGVREVYFSVSFGRGSLTNSPHGFVISIDVGLYHDGSGIVSGHAVLDNWMTMLDASGDAGEIVGVKSEFGFSVFTNVSLGSYYQSGFAIERLSENNIPSPDGIVSMICGSGRSTGTSGTYISPYFQASNFEGGKVFSAIGGQSASNSTKLFSNPQVIPHTEDPSFASKAPAITMDTFGKYDPCHHWVLASKYMYSAGSEFTAIINGDSGTYRIPTTGFYADNGSATNSVLFIALRVA